MSPRYERARNEARVKCHDHDQPRVTRVPAGHDSSHGSARIRAPTLEGMRSVSIDQQRLLDWLFGIAAVSGALPTLILPTLDPDTGIFRATVLAVAVAVLVVLWLVRRRHASTAVTVTFVLVALVASYTGDTLLAMMPELVALLLIVVDFGPSVGIGFIVANAALQATLMTTVVQSPASNTAIQTLATSIVLIFIYAFALLLRHSAAENAVRAGLIRERDAANVQLTAANTRLAEANEALRGSIEMEKELVLAEERARSARELHDGLGHRLTLAGMYLDVADRRRRSEPDHPEKAWAQVADARQTVQEAMSEMRLWVRALNPVRVEGAEGVAALDSIAQAFRGTGVDVRFTVTGDERPLPAGAVLFCHRFVQEGLTNSLRHARARRVDIGVDYTATDVTITLADDGGDQAVHTPPGSPITPGFGLRSLAERAAQLGGTFEARRGETRFVLTATVPAPVPAVVPTLLPTGAHA